MVEIPDMDGISALFGMIMTLPCRSIWEWGGERGMVQWTRQRSKEIDMSDHDGDLDLRMREARRSSAKENTNREKGRDFG
jgi:hypothetical protein